MTGGGVVVDGRASILVINVARIGDTLLVTPAIRALREAFPGGKIGCLLHPARVELLRGLPWLDALGTITPKTARWRGRIGGMRWDVALVYGKDAPLIRYAARVAERVVAFKQGREELDQLLWRAVEAPGDMHAVHERLLLPQAIGVTTRDFRLAFFPSEAERARAAGFMDRNVPATGKRLVAMQTASFPTKSYRDWPIESFADLGRRILDAYPDAHLILLGGKESRKRAAWLAGQLGPRATVLAGRMGIRDTAAVLERVRLYVGVDTGPTHLAGALGIPMVALYHCHHPGRNLVPLGHDRLRAIEHPATGSRCTRETPMSMIPVEAVWRQVRSLLDPVGIRGCAP
ncbi:MAG: hypothetical protein H6Q84_528 [Deltaproteobacteria bacterium]|nr:hypothetical protein [Deltaproteobacteria bacterium]